jgi:hypothetical protein
VVPSMMPLGVGASAGPAKLPAGISVPVSPPPGVTTQSEQRSAASGQMQPSRSTGHAADGEGAEDVSAGETGRSRPHEYAHEWTSFPALSVFHAAPLRWYKMCPSFDLVHLPLAGGGGRQGSSHSHDPIRRTTSCCCF